MLGRIFAILLILLGLGTAGAGIASGTVWRPDEVVTATLPQDPETPVVLARGHVLATVNPEVTVTVTGADGETPVLLAMGRAEDVRAWVGDAPATEITGLEDWETLSVEQVSGAEATEEPSDGASADASESPTEGTETEDTQTEDAETEGAEGTETESADADTPEAEMTTVPDPRGSDLWIEELSETGELTYEWSQVEGDWLMLVATDGSTPAPTVSLTWTREVTTPLMVPGIIVGGVLFLIGLVWLVILLLMAREEKRARRRAAETEDGAEDATAAVPVVAEDGKPLTRRQLREAARSEAATRPKRSPVAPTEDTVTEPGAAADTPESVEGGNPAGDGATDLASWVNSGRQEETPDNAASDQGAASTQPGVETDAAAAEARTTDGGPARTEADDVPPPRRWWQRIGRSSGSGRANQDADEENAARLGDFSAWGAPTIGAGASTEESAGRPAGSAQLPPPESPGDPDEEHNPQASGASWRQTWGMQPPVPDEGPKDPPTDGDEEDQR